MRRKSNTTSTSKKKEEKKKASEASSSKSSSSSAATASSSSSATTTTTNNTNSDPKKVIVPLEWVPLSVGQVIIPSQTKDEPNTAADIAIEVKSRIVKNLETYPSDCLFRTHQYDFTLTPTRELLEWAKIDYGFYSKIKLFTFTPKGEEEDDYDNGEWNECFSSEGRPVITDSHTEDYENGVWKITLYWQNAKVFKFKPVAKFRFEIDVYRACTDRDIMKKVATKISSPFRLLSKPEVYLKSLTKKRKGSSSNTNHHIEDEDAEEIDSMSIVSSSTTATTTTTTTTMNPNKKMKISPTAVKNNLAPPPTNLNIKAIITTETSHNLLEESKEEIILEEGGASSPILAGFRNSNFPSSDDFNANDIETNIVQSPIIVASSLNEYSHLQSTPPFLTPPPGSPVLVPQSNKPSTSQEFGVHPLFEPPITSQEGGNSDFNTSDIFFSSGKDFEGPSSSLGSIFSSQ